MRGITQKLSIRQETRIKDAFYKSMKSDFTNVAQLERLKDAIDYQIRMLMWPEKFGAPIIEKDKQKTISETGETSDIQG